MYRRAGRRCAYQPTSTVRTSKEEKFTGFVFKIQANMDPKHTRDRACLYARGVRKYEKGMKLRQVRTGKTW